MTKISKKDYEYEEYMRRERKYEEWVQQELINYDKKRHLKLLNEHEQDEKFYKELRSYQVLLYFHLTWEAKDQYLEMIHDYTEKKIDSRSFDFESRFIDRFTERSKSIEELTEILISNRVLLSPDKNSVSFGLLVERIIDYCREPCEIENFEFQIEKVYSKIQDLLGDA